MLPGDERLLRDHVPDGAEERRRTAHAACGIGLTREPAELDPRHPRTELQTKVLEHDCAATAPGAHAEWSPPVRTAVSSCLNSRFPILLMSGPQRVMIYNDAYA